MLCSDFDYALPEELIAQQPIDERDQSRMLILDRDRGTWSDSVFASLPALLTRQDVVVLNNTRVFPARLLGHRMSKGIRGAEVEALLLKRTSTRTETNEWEVLAKPGRILKPGIELEFGGGSLKGTIIATLEEGRRLIRFETTENFEEVVDRIGKTPLPPYIKRTPGIDREGEVSRVEAARYQTIFASERGAIAAPTAGLHFTQSVLRELRAHGTEVVEITHHVGYATFQPIRVQNVEDHQIGEESYHISKETASVLNRATEEKRRIIAVGTTTVRAIESAASPAGTVSEGWGRTHLFIYPGYRFRLIGGLITNFHLPQSSLLMLVAAFSGRDLVLSAYRHAVDDRYRFYSYGDCMLII